MKETIRKLALAATLVGGVALAQSTTSPTPPPTGTPNSTDSRSGYPKPSITDPAQPGPAPEKMERSSQSSGTDSAYGGSGDAGTGSHGKKGKKTEGSSSDSTAK